MQIIKSKRGSGLIELLIGIAIAIPIIIAAVNSFKSAALSYNSLIKSISSIQAYGKLDTHLMNISREYDQHLFKLPPVIHRNGQIKFISGQLNPVSQRTDSLRPTANSDAITHVDITFKNTFIIKQINQSGIYLDIFGCPKFPPSFVDIPTDTGSYLIFTSERVSEFIGTRTLWGPSAQKCFKISGNVSAGMINGNRPLTEPYYALGIIPIRRIYTLYIDSLGRLRFLGHRGSLNTENQPLADGPISVRYSMKSWPSASHSQIAALFWPDSNRKFEKIYLSKLAKQSLLSISFNEL